MPRPILLYDGVCGFCNRMVQFILRRDRNAVFRFAALQSAFAREILARHGAIPVELDTFYVVLHHKQAEESLLPRSEAVLFVFKKLGGFWRALGAIGRVVPRPLLDFAYRTIANNRYRLFGRYDECPIPPPEVRARFLD